MSTIRKLLSVNAVVAGSLVLGIINSVAIAAIFGLDRRIDAYFASLVLIRLFMELIVDYLGKNFLPVFASRRKESFESASELASLIVTQVSIGAIVAIGILAVSSPYIFSLILPGFEAGDIDIVAGTFVIMVPSLLFMVIESFHQYIWQHDEQYVRVMLARALNSLTLMVFIVGLGPWFGVLVLPLGFLCGQLLSVSALSIAVPYNFRFRVGLSDPDVRQIFRNSFVLMGTGVFARSRSVIVQYFGSYLGEGAISAMAIAYRLCEPVFQKALVGIRMIVFSRSAKASAKKDIAEFVRLYRISILGVLLFVLPIAAWYVLESNIIVRAVFQRGEFNDEMANLVTAALAGYAGMVVFAGIVQILSNGFYALNKISVPAAIMPIGTGIFLLLAALLSPRLGVFGLTLSSSITSAVLATGLTILFRRHVPGLPTAEILAALVKYFVSACIAVFVAMTVRESLGLTNIAGMILSSLSVALVYVALLYLMKDNMLQFIVDKVGIKLLKAGRS